MKVLFLDIDGVLNNYNWFSTPDYKKLQKQYKDVDYATRMRYTHIDPKCFANLNFLLKSVPELKIVLSSTWRIADITRDAFNLLGKDIDNFNVRFLGYTDVLKSRGQEIQKWLDRHPADAFVIIDDNRDMEHLTHKLMRIDGINGLSKQDVQAAIAILNQ